MSVFPEYVVLYCQSLKMVLKKLHCPSASVQSEISWKTVFKHLITIAFDLLRETSDADEMTKLFQSYMVPHTSIT